MCVRECVGLHGLGPGGCAGEWLHSPPRGPGVSDCPGDLFSKDSQKNHPLGPSTDPGPLWSARGQIVVIDKELTELLLGARLCSNKHIIAPVHRNYKPMR